MIQSFDDYRQSLRDGREVYYRGKRVEDVNAHPVLNTQVNLLEYISRKNTILIIPT